MEAEERAPLLEVERGVERVIVHLDSAVPITLSLDPATALTLARKLAHEAAGMQEE